MSPRGRSSKPIQPGPDQGAFFGVESTANGATDPSDFAMTAEVVVPPDGEVYYPPTASTVPGVDKGDAVSIEAVQAGLDKKANVTRNRRLGNKGLHGAQHPETGNYADGLWVGSVLPPLRSGGKRMIVTASNWPAAMDHAKALDRQRAAQERANPTFDSDIHEVKPVVDALAEALDLDRAISSSDEPEETTTERVPAQITSEEKLAIIREKAGFTPATHDEKNTAIGLIFSATENGPHWTHSYLMETYDHLVKLYANTEGRVLNEAKKMASEGVVSRINEMGDYLQQSRDDGEALLWLQQKLDATTNPSLTLEEVVTDTFDPIEPGEDLRTKDGQLVLWAMAAIVRYIDAETHQELNFLPMTEREDRSIDSAQEGKNKQLYNPYVAAFMLTDERPGIMEKYEAIRTHVMDQVRAITAAELRTLVPRALNDQRRRYGFWKQALLDVKGSYKPAAKQRLDS